MAFVTLFCVFVVSKITHQYKDNLCIITSITSTSNKIKNAILNLVDDRIILLSMSSNKKILIVICAALRFYASQPFGGTEDNMNLVFHNKNTPLSPLIFVFILSILGGGTSI